MKILSLFLLLTICMVRVYSQSTLPLRADTVVIEKVGGNATLKVKDSSRNTVGGILTNIGNGVYVGKKPRVNADTLFIGTDTFVVSSPGTQTLQQVFDQGSVLTKPDTVYQQNNLLLTTGQFANGDTIHYDENQKLLVYGVSIDRGDTSGANNLYSTDWVKQLAASMGLYTDNRSVSGSKLIKVSNGDNSLEDLLPAIPVYNSTVKLLAIGNYQVNEVDFNDSTLYRSTLEMILDTLIIARGYPATKIFLLNGTPARLKDTARLRRLSVATMNVAIEKGCLYWDSYSYMLPCLSCNRSGGDDVHLTPHGYFYLTDGILNASVIDSLNYIRANNMHVENAFTSHGDLYANGITNYGKDSTFGNQYIGGTLNLVGNVLNATTFNNGITVTGDAVPNAQKWVLFRNGNVRYGMGLSGTDYRIFTSNATIMRLGSISASDGTTFTPTFSTSTGSNTSHVPFIASSSASVGTALTVTGGASIGGDVTFREINVYNNGGLKFGSRMSGSSPFFNDIYCGHNITTNAVRLGWVDASNVFTPVLSAVKTGAVLIGTGTDFGRRLFVNGSVGILKDSVQLSASLGARHILTLDTSNNKVDRVNVSLLQSNFANTDLTFNGNRTHNANSNSFALNNMNGMQLHSVGTVFSRTQYGLFRTIPSSFSSPLTIQYGMLTADGLSDSSVTNTTYNFDGSLTTASKTVGSPTISYYGVTNTNINIKPAVDLNIKATANDGSGIDSVFVPGPIIEIGGDDVTYTNPVYKVPLSALVPEKQSFSQTATVTVDNTTTETTLIGSGAGSLTIQPSEWVAGATYRIKVHGILGTDAVSPGTTNFRLKLGSTTIATTGGIFQGTNISGRNFEITTEFVCRTTGATGTVMTMGFYQDRNSAGNRMDDSGSGTPTTIDMTASQTLDFTLEWSQAAAGNTCSVYIIYFQRLN